MNQRLVFKSDFVPCAIESQPTPLNVTCIQQAGALISHIGLLKIFGLHREKSAAVTADFVPIVTILSFVNEFRNSRGNACVHAVLAI